ncbi:MAG: T9SS-dependent M36 family metallopeptidase [Saprospiraceae bacterium]
MNSLSTKKVLISTLFILLLGSAWAQQQTPLDIALRYLEQEHHRWQLDKADVADVLVSNQYQTRHNGVTHVYFLQRHAGIPVHDAILSVHITVNGKVGFANSRFIPQLASKINAKAPLVTPLQSIIYAARQLELPGKAAPVFVEQTEQNELIFEDENISRVPIKVKLMYQAIADGSVRLAWDLAIRQVNTPDYWSVRVDALTGALLAKDNWTVYCNFDAVEGHQHHENCTAEAPALRFLETKQALLQNHYTPNGVDDAQYNVFPIPVESPIHGQRQLVVSPANPLASPYGWHDTNGVPGAEFRITRGNNVHAYLDLNDRDVSSQNEPQGGANLLFDFPFDPRQEPIGLRDASVTQLFYMNNIMHDLTYHYGFDEVAGNFQKNNYGRGGNGEDYVFAHSQDGGGTNNANFSTPGDGSSPTMQMYLWSRAPSTPLIITQPSAIARTYPTSTSDFGVQYGNAPVTGQIVAAFDTSTTAPQRLCSPAINASELAGKIALVERGICTFKSKVLQAQQAGAIGVIICNTDNTFLTMANDTSIPTNPSIPVVMLRASDCVLIRENLNKGVTATIQLSRAPQPLVLDASFDNGIVAHEYGHGISTRLTGGPANSGCLNNDEQMGEGWSDFFTLITSVKTGDTGALARGIGTYVENRDPRARGIRRYPYSTDMSINPQTYDDIIGTTRPHPLGEIWAATLWDLYWKMVEVYGFDDNLYTGKGGNNLAIQLVMDGMKLQSCDPGFIDGRDAILAADFINNEGANQCLIWEVFARRGLGWSANQGSTVNRNDGRQAFDIAPECTKQVLVNKRVTPLIDAGDTIAVAIEVTNYKDEAVTTMVVTDELPIGTNYIAGSANAPAQVNNGVIRFTLEALEPGESKIFTYQLSTSANNYSLRQFLDNLETGTTNWRVDSLLGADLWRISNQRAFSGRRSWLVPSTIRRNDQTLQLNTPIRVSGVQPVLRFYHNFDINPGLDGGILQISTDGGTTWQNTDSLFFRNGYSGRVAPSTFAMSPIQAYWGNSSGFTDSYLDLQSFIGQEILVRFRFASLEKQFASGAGWWIDDIEFFDMYNYNTEACVVTKEGDQACAMASSRGTIVQPQTSLTDTDEPQSLPLRVALYPNPADDLVNISITATQATENAAIRILGTDGRLISQQNINLLSGNQTIPLRIHQLTAGFYLVEVKTADSIITKKMIVK